MLLISKPILNLKRVIGKPERPKRYLFWTACPSTGPVPTFPLLPPPPKVKGNLKMHDVHLYRTSQLTWPLYTISGVFIFASLSYVNKETQYLDWSVNSLLWSCNSHWFLSGLINRKISEIKRRRIYWKKNSECSVFICFVFAFVLFC